MNRDLFLSTEGSNTWGTTKNRCVTSGYPHSPVGRGRWRPLRELPVPGFVGSPRHVSAATTDPRPTVEDRGRRATEETPSIVPQPLHSQLSPTVTGETEHDPGRGGGRGGVLKEGDGDSSETHSDTTLAPDTHLVLNDPDLSPDSGTTSRSPRLHLERSKQTWWGRKGGTLRLRSWIRGYRKGPPRPSPSPLGSPLWGSRDLRNLESRTLNFSV